MESDGLMEQSELTNNAISLSLVTVSTKTGSADSSIIRVVIPGHENNILMESALLAYNVFAVIPWHTGTIKLIDGIIPSITPARQSNETICRKNVSISRRTS